jgi:hypothetical protein
VISQATVVAVGVTSEGERQVLGQPRGRRRHGGLVPCAWAGHRVSVRVYPERVVIVADQHVVAEHPRAEDRDHVVYDWQHYLPLVERKPGALPVGSVGAGPASESHPCFILFVTSMAAPLTESPMRRCHSQRVGQHLVWVTLRRAGIGDG